MNRAEKFYHDQYKRIITDFIALYPGKYYEVGIINLINSERNGGITDIHKIICDKYIKYSEKSFNNFMSGYFWNFELTNGKEEEYSYDYAMNNPKYICSHGDIL